MEIIASRVLAPHFGNSIYVWGSLIGVFLAALSVGYGAGGRIADRHPSSRLFVGIVFVAGLLTVPIPLLAAPILVAITQADLGPQLSPLAGAIALFALPSIVMGMVSPFAVRLRANSLTTMGQTAGALFTISTTGSIVGTVAASFFLINYFGVREIIYLLGFTLMAVAVLGWVWARRPLAAAQGAWLAGVLWIGVTRAVPAPDSSVVYARDSAYSRVTVSDEEAVRYMWLDNHLQSALDLNDPRRTPSYFGYVNYMHLPLIFTSNPRPRHVTLLGLGGGTLPNRYVADYPTVVMDVAEIDPEVVAVAQRYFSVRQSERLRIDVRDGRLHLQLAREPRDIILTDAYLKDRIPFHLATREFLALARSRLAPGGVVTSNVAGAVDGPNSRLFRAVYKTFGDVFRTVYVFPVGFSRDGLAERQRNIILVATNESVLPAGEVGRRAEALVANGVVTVDGFLDAAGDLYGLSIRTDDVPVLSDDFAPVDALISPR